ncbi:C69 family dipeptidase [bacterium]|nr:C69 family dipeptidase [bacterium]
MNRHTCYRFAFLLAALLAWPRAYLSACDTWVARNDATRVAATLLAKNSDRTVFDCQPLFYYPAREWPAGSVIDLGRVTIPQSRKTYATIGSGPYWCWGYEEGMNEFGVAIGNEGIATRPLAELRETVMSGGSVEYGPTGMDLLRLGLERGKTAREALEVITSLLEAYGQFGSGLPTAGVEAAYDNSFLIADRKEAWILETAGRQWAARRITESVGSISNMIRITTRWDIASEQLRSHALEKQWYRETDGLFNFEEVYGSSTPAERLQTRRSRIRADRSCGLLRDHYGSITTATMAGIARDRGSTPAIDMDLTASSCVAEIPDDPDEIAVFWWAPSVPSSSCYVPFFIEAGGIPDILSRAGTRGRKIVRPSAAERDEFSGDSYWWLFRDLADLVNLDRDSRIRTVRNEFDALEETFRERVTAVKREAAARKKAGDDDAAAGLLAAFTRECVNSVILSVNELRDTFREQSVRVTQQLAPYLGSYTANFGMYRNTVFRIEEKNHLLTLIIPGSAELSFTYPDENGYWLEKMSGRVALTFSEDSSGQVTGMLLHQTTPFAKTAGPEEPLPEGVPDEVKDLPGTYELAMAGASYRVFIRDMVLVIDVGQGHVLGLTPPTGDGVWGFEGDNSAAVSFDRGEDGTVTVMNLHQSFPVHRGLSAAYAAEEIIAAGSVREGIEALQRWRDDPGYFIDETDINALGYRLLNAGNTAAAIEIFRFNVTVFPLSFNVYDSLGEAFMLAGNREEAIRNYRKSLELNPNNDGGRKMLEKLEGAGE